MFQSVVELVVALRELFFHLASPQEPLQEGHLNLGFGEDMNLGEGAGVNGVE